MRTLLCLLALVAAPAYAEWVKMGVHKNYTHYIDPATIGKEGHLRRVGEMIDMRQRDPVGGAFSLRALVEYNCKSLELRMLSGASHSEPMGRGNVIEAKDSDAWMLPPPYSIAAEILATVCCPAAGPCEYF